jgi:hypothetical protein
MLHKRLRRVLPAARARHMATLLFSLLRFVGACPNHRSTFPRLVMLPAVPRNTSD